MKLLKWCYYISLFVHAYYFYVALWIYLHIRVYYNGHVLIFHSNFIINTNLFLGRLILFIYFHAIHYKIQVIIYTQVLTEASAKWALN